MFFFFPKSVLIARRSQFLYHPEFVFLQKEQIHAQKTVLLFVGTDCPCGWGSAWKTAAISAQQGVGVSHGLNISFQVGFGLCLARCRRLRLSDKARNRGLCTDQKVLSIILCLIFISESVISDLKVVNKYMLQWDTEEYESFLVFFFFYYKTKLLNYEIRSSDFSSGSGPYFVTGILNVQHKSLVEVCKSWKLQYKK